MAHPPRSTASAKQNQHHRNQHQENGSSHTNTILSSAKALRLVYCDEDGSFRMDAEAVASLQLVKGPLGVVSVCGRARQGKSFILNQLLGSSGFQVASTHRPCTKGLWMWSTPIQRTALDGTEYSVLLLDTEGIDAYDQTGTYSTQIFSLAVLLSSMFIYNQMGGIDEAALDRLSLVTEMTKHIRVRASEHRPSNAELGQFSPIFVWLLRDFYLDLSDEHKKISPREYLEGALQPIPGQGKSIGAKNEIRESIRSLFPDRDCFTLVRPLNEERDLQRLDQIPLENLRPEFRSDLDALTKFVFERTKPKQLGPIVMNGPILAALTQSFLDAINAGAVPTIATSWQCVEESECRHAHEAALERYGHAFSGCAIEDEHALRTMHESATEEALNFYNSEAVGTGVARKKYEKLLIAAIKRSFEEKLRKVTIEAELKCVKMVEKMDEEIWTICQSSETTLGHALEVLDNLVSEYDEATSGPAKWKKFVKFLQNSLEGPLSGIVKRVNHQSATESTTIQIKYRALEEKLLTTEKQLAGAEINAQEWKRRYESVLDESKSSEAAFSSRYLALQKTHNAMEEKYLAISHQVESLRKEASDWRTQYEEVVYARNAREEQLNLEIRGLQNRCSAAEGRLSAAREQLQSAKAEADEWKRKYETAIEESNTTSEKASAICDRVTKHSQDRQDALREEFLSNIALKEMEYKDAQTKLEEAERYIASIEARLEDREQKFNVEEEELATLRLELKTYKAQSDSAKANVISLQKQLDIVSQEKNHLEERLRTVLSTADEVEEKRNLAEEEMRLAIERADKAHEEASIAKKEKLEAEMLAAERLSAQESAERRCEALCRERDELCEEVEILRMAEKDTVFRVKSLDRQLEIRDKEMEGLLDSAHKQRANTIQVLESLLDSERQANAEANARAEALSQKLQATQNKLDALQQELSTTRLNEVVLDGKLRIRHLKTSPGKRTRADDDIAPEESVQNVAEEENDSNPSARKKPCNSTNENGNTPSHSQCDFELLEDITPIKTPDMAI